MDSKVSRSICIIFLFLVLLVAIVALDNENKAADLTHSDNSVHAFTHPLSTLSSNQLSRFHNGRIIFHGLGTDNRSLESRGIGPKYSATTCASCHVNDNRGDPKLHKSNVIQLFNPSTKNNQDPIYGSHIQEFSTSGLPEAKIIRTSKSTTLGELYLGEFHKDTSTQVRIAPSIAGAGLIEAIPDSFFIRMADPNDVNNDGISGRISFVSHNGKTKIGRFGWTASKTTVKDQTLTAAYEDIGLTNSYFHEGKTTRDLSYHNEKNLIFYARSVAPPKSRDLTNIAKQGQKHFRSIGCASCHIEQIEIERTDIVKEQHTTIKPYSDFLLHNMGPELTDTTSTKNREADEFRTAPLWGIGLMKSTTGYINLMHDGRAKSLTEAIELHGGEASQSRTKFRSLTPKQNKELLTYLDSL